MPHKKLVPWQEPKIAICWLQPQDSVLEEAHLPLQGYVTITGDSSSWPNRTSTITKVCLLLIFWKLIIKNTSHTRGDTSEFLNLSTLASPSEKSFNWLAICFSCHYDKFLVNKISKKSKIIIKARKNLERLATTRMRQQRWKSSRATC